jgi:uncharacterized protein (TIGR00661 family)
MGQIVNAFYSGQVETIVSSFYFPPLKHTSGRVTQIGVLLRPEILEASMENRNHVVIYLRRFNFPALLKHLEQCGMEVRIYGLGKHPSYHNLRFFEIDLFRFVEDLATCRALVSTAGNQLVGESLFLGKPVLAMPEKGNYEQFINAHFLQESNSGMAIEMDRFTPDIVRKFMDNLEFYKTHIDRDQQYGNPKALSIINRYLPETSMTSVHTPSTSISEEVPA